MFDCLFALLKTRCAAIAATACFVLCALKLTMLCHAIRSDRDKWTSALRAMIQKAEEKRKPLVVDDRKKEEAAKDREAREVSCRERANASTAIKAAIS